MIAYFDIFSGISGDMTLGALIDLGVPIEWLQSQIKTILDSEVEIKSESIQRNGLSAQNIFVIPINNPDRKNYRQIKKIISHSNFSDNVKKQSLDAFEKIALAESKIHSQDINHVHFHEVGSIDAIVDIIGTFLCLEYLKIETVYSSKVCLGSGFVECSHGIIPVPSPATLAILKGVPVKAHESNINSELVTPTGAAIIKTLALKYGKIPEMIIDNVGYGSGKRDTGSHIPNLLRIILGRENKNFLKENVYVIETTIDDMPQEYSGYIFEQLFNIGALDVCHIPVQMKKNRPGTRLEVLCKESELKKIIDFIFHESTTTGIRYYETERVTLQREAIQINTKFGEIVAKKIHYPDQTIEILPEYEELKKIATQLNIPLKKVYQQVNLDINSL